MQANLRLELVFSISVYIYNSLLVKIWLNTVTNA